MESAPHTAGRAARRWVWLILIAACLLRTVALSSDAHVPDQLGHRYEDALELLGSLGVSEIADFEGRVRRMVPLG